MRIKKITNQHRRDFRAIYVCEHCDAEEVGTGYDDEYFHSVVIPKKMCSKCGETANKSYKPLSTKYKDSEVV